MSILSWNCRGLGGSSTVRELQRLLQTQNPSVVFLCETKIGGIKFESLRTKLGMFGFSVDAKGKKGGLALLWRKNMDICLQCFSDYFIDAKVQDEDGMWRITGIYGLPEVHQRKITWNLMRKLNKGNTLPWICIGDYNEILNGWECRGGRRRPTAQIDSFKQVVRELGLLDLPAVGYAFTWAKNWKKVASYRARLDRALINSQFQAEKKCMRVIHLDTNQSDHLPILVPWKSRKYSRQQPRRNRKKFRFESMWVRKSEVRNVIDDAWKNSPNDLLKKLDACKNSLMVWKSGFGNIFKEEDKIRNRIAELKFDKTNTDHELEIAALQGELEERLDEQEMHWRQRSRTLWLKEGDKNTSYFHNVATRRQKSNQITGLRDDSGNWVESDDELHGLVVNYFKNLFASELKNLEIMNQVLDRINVRISTADFAKLNKEFTADEVQNVLFQMHPLKAPGPDGFNPQFFQKYWDVVGHETSSFIIHMLRSKQIPSEVDFGVLNPTRGIRQGDPISPYLFLMCTDVLSRLLIDANLCRKIQGIRIGKEGPRICHLMFADDTILFGVASVEEAKSFAELLRIYSMVSGQKVNVQKSSIVFSRNVPECLKKDICDIFNFQEVQKHEKYLGLPTITGHSKMQLFKNVKERILSKINGWKEKLLSRAGKEVLLKAVVQSIPTYAMSVFKLPDAMIDEIQSEIANFWWGRKEHKKNIHWLSWHTLCKSKELGGLGFRDLKSFNAALLAKHVWRFLTDEGSLLFKVYKHLYFRESNFMDVTLKSNASFSWRSIIWARDQMKDGFLWHIGNGTKVNIFNDKWIPSLYPRRIYPHQITEQIDTNSTVAWLINEESRTWNEEKLRMLNDEEADAIRQIPLGEMSDADLISWPFSKNGCYTVRSGYHFIQQKRMEQVNSASTSSSSNSSAEKRFWKVLWTLHIPTKVKIFCWRLCLNALPSQDNLVRRRMLVDTLCPICETEDGSLVHLFINCPVATQVWALSFLGSLIKPQNVTNLRDWVEWVFKNCDKDVIEKFVIILWSIWKQRNNLVFNKEKMDPMSLLIRALNYWQDYRDANKQETSRPEENRYRRWEPPVQGSLKINVDAASDGEGRNGLGMIVRDSRGQFSYAQTRSVPHLRDVQTLELLAIKSACIWCKERQIKDIIIESDAKMVVQMLKDDDAQRRDQYQLIVRDIQKISHGQRFTFRWIPRDANNVAHLLASFAKSNHGEHNWQDDPPSFLNQALLSDVVGE